MYCCKLNRNELFNICFPLNPYNQVRSKRCSIPVLIFNIATRFEDYTKDENN